MNRVTTVADPAGSQTKTTIDALVQRGLEKYGQGDLVGAVAEWEKARGLDPAAERPTQYIDYVRANFQLLEEQFREARDIAQEALRSGIPLGEALEQAADVELDDDYYGELVVDGAPGGAAGDDDATRDYVSFADVLSEVDEGWALDDLVPLGDLPSSSQSAVDRLGPSMELTADGIAAVSGGELGDGAAERAAYALLRGERYDSRADTDADDYQRADTLSLDLYTGVPQPLDRELSTPADENAAAIEEAIAAAAEEEAEELTVPGGEEPPPLPDSPALSADALRAIRSPVDEELRRPAPVADPGAPTQDFDSSALRELRADRRDDRIVEESSESVPVPRVTFHDIGTSEKTMPARPSMRTSIEDFAVDLNDLDLPASGAGDPAMAGRASATRRAEPAPLDLDDELTAERGGSRGDRAFGWGSSLADRLDDELTAERGPGRRSDPLEIELPGDERPPTEDPELRGAAGVIVDESLLLPTEDGPRIEDVEDDEDKTGQLRLDEVRPTAELPRRPARDEASDYDRDLSTREHRSAASRGRASTSGRHDAVPIDVLASQMLGEVDHGAPAGESSEDRTRRRVEALIERAAAEHKAHHPSPAVLALDLALGEEPDSALAQKIIHRKRDLILEIFESYIGDPHACPTVAMPMHEIAMQELDSRAAFLLSRIDGSLSFDEILDVAGMSRLEAYRHLCRLLLRGILEVR